ncbi:hypothetical protein [Pedobacter sp. GR22-6]|uniref:hypothetical protein n=1 Tax=Pedobacter sp. GR22-6 TaxID=3127957 RepID=UPI00307F6F09
MESKELRLGNIVNFLSGRSWLQGQVTNIGKSDCVIDTYSVKAADIQGIAITEEWLLKFGFIEMEDTVPEGFPTFSPLNFTGKFRLYYSETNHKFNLDVMNFMEGDLVERVLAINHVHQVQNLFFALTGEDLEMQPNTP